MDSYRHFHSPVVTMLNPIRRTAQFPTKKELSKVGKTTEIKLFCQTKFFMISHAWFGELLPILFTSTFTNNPPFIYITYWKDRLKPISETLTLEFISPIQFILEMGLKDVVHPTAPCILEKTHIPFTSVPLPWSSKETKKQSSFQKMFNDLNYYCFLK